MSFDPLNWLYIRPDENVLNGRTVTSTAGTPDPDFHLSYLTDQRPAFPAKWAAGAWGASISVATRSVQLISVGNHSLDGNVTVGGGVSGTITLATPPPNLVLLNPYLLLANAVAGVNTLTLSGTNTAAAHIGEAIAGVPRELKPLLMSDNNDAKKDGRKPLSGDYLNIPMFDERRNWRIFGGSQYYTLSQLNDLIAWQDAQRGEGQPSLLITDQAVNDARMVLINELSWTRGPNKDTYRVTLSFFEFPRFKW